MTADAPRRTATITTRAAAPGRSAPDRVAPPRPGGGAGGPRTARAFYRSSTGKKVVMAVTGLVLMGFVTAHTVGNLKIFLGAADIDHYGEFLRDMLVPILPRTMALWGIRSLVIVALVLHVHAAWGLTRVNRRARGGTAYVFPRDMQAATMAGRSMRWTGVVLLLFLGYHLANFTWGWVNPGFERGEVYRNVTAAFENPVVAWWYVIANLALGLHLYHGAWSMFQSLGLNHPRWNTWRRGFATTFATVITTANVSIPLSVWLGYLD